MASQLDTLAERPKWQIALIWAVFAGMLGGGWYFMYFEEAVQQNEAAEIAVKKAEAELARMKERLANFEQEMAQAKAMEQELEEKKRRLPLSSATVDHLMRKFQQQGRLVGVSVLDWSPAPEQKLDFYAKMPVNISASGTWLQFGEFFRRISEMEQIVNVEGIAMKPARRESYDGSVSLTVQFVASTYRFLEQEVRKPKASGGRSKARGQEAAK